MNFQQYPLSVVRSEMVGDAPFENDKFGFENLAVRMAGYLDRLNGGAVLSINAQWGQGKTYFALNFSKYLENNGTKVIYLDAFKNDYVDDPFIVLSSEISKVISKDKSSIQKFHKKAGAVASALLPAATKAIARLASKAITGSANFSEEVMEEVSSALKEGGDFAGKWAEDAIKRHEKEKESFEGFREILRSYTVDVYNSTNKPVIFFIDELDRCNPIFSVKVLERIKHFFDVPNLIFILLIHKDQLENAIKGVYGNNTNAHLYLGKFLNFSFDLPWIGRSNAPLFDFCKTEFDKYRLPNEPDMHEFISVFTFFARQFSLSLREIERAVSLFVFSLPLEYDFEKLAYLIVLKIKYGNAYFKSLIERGFDSHELAISRIKDLSRVYKQNSTRENRDIYDELINWHRSIISPDAQESIAYLGKVGWGQNQQFVLLDEMAKKIDLTLR
ncbi:P-loop NTPase fold protein [Janthinobacterium sp. SUN026]|uniref:KAP family P-loop NTPase fold protein n=1 Tax=Janthinobacterium sp. SUN026 TaxID=3002438 RepID=UPI0025B17F3B|nr:P-loop NTPase fold protein [Janthinobacterium sp. SUN026]MDN2671447.1 P-loop NTPase fold protein [Janthinobacterium sp. SUN026]